MERRQRDTELVSLARIRDVRASSRAAAEQASFMDRLTKSRGFGLLMDIAVMFKSLLASVAIVYLMSSSDVIKCNSVSVQYHAINSAGVDVFVTTDYIKESTVKYELCQPTYPFDSERKLFIVLVVLNQLLFAAAIFLKSTVGRWHFFRVGQRAIVTSYVIASTAGLLAVIKVMIICFLEFVPISFSCPDDGFVDEHCLSKTLAVNISKLLDPGCTQGCVSTFNCKEPQFSSNTYGQSMCVINIPIELYLLVINFILAFLYICYLGYEFTMGERLLRVALRNANEQAEVDHTINSVMKQAPMGAHTLRMRTNALSRERQKLTTSSQVNAG